MSEPTEAAQPEAVPLIDPDVIPVRIVNGVANMNYFGSLFDMMFTTNFLGCDEYGNMQAQRVVAARLRFDIDFARALHDNLGRMIDALTAPAKDKVN